MDKIQKHRERVGDEMAQKDLQKLFEKLSKKGSGRYLNIDV